MGAHTVTDHDDAPFDSALRQHLHSATEPDDDGFSLRVMAALPAPVPQRRWAGWVRLAQWVAISLAACGTAALLSGADAPLDTPRAVAAVTLMGLLIFWSVPSRWSRG